MIIDFRVRPPMAGYLHTLMFSNVSRSVRMTLSLGMRPAPSAEQLSMPLFMQEMDEAGIVCGVLQGRAPNGVFGGVPVEDLRSIMHAYPGRFQGFCGIDSDDIPEALRTIEREVVRGDMTGVVLEPGITPCPMFADDRRLFPLYEYCSSKDIPMVVMAGGNAGPDVIFTEPVHIEHVASDFPRLHIIVSHGGWPWVQQILYVAYRWKNVYVAPDMYLCNVPGWQDYVTAANGYLQDRFLFSTAYPFLPLVEAVEQFVRLPFRREILSKLLYENAASLLKM